MKLTRPLAKTTAQQVKPLIHKNLDSKCQRTAKMTKEGKIFRVKQVLIYGSYLNKFTTYASNRAAGPTCAASLDMGILHNTLIGLIDSRLWVCLGPDPIYRYYFGKRSLGCAPPPPSPPRTPFLLEGWTSYQISKNWGNLSFERA